jgi:hypothetical protein
MKSIGALFTGVLLFTCWAFIQPAHTQKYALPQGLSFIEAPLTVHQQVQENKILIETLRTEISIKLLEIYYAIEKGA